jgi:hypothetical protein
MLAEIFMLRLEALSRNLNGLARADTREARHQLKLDAQWPKG